MVRPRLVQQAHQAFEQAFGGGVRPRVAAAPGRINLIGEHTDYNDGFVLPMAIDRHIAVAFAPRADRVLRAHAVEPGETRELSLESLERRTAADTGKWGRRGGWFGYLAGVAWAMLGAGHVLRGADLAISSNLAIGAGLSSSAALEIAVARALAAASDRAWDPFAFARLAQRAEHEFAGVACGIMDQLSVAVAREGVRRVEIQVVQHRQDAARRDEAAADVQALHRTDAGEPGGGGARVLGIDHHVAVVQRGAGQRDQAVAFFESIGYPGVMAYLVILGEVHERDAKRSKSSDDRTSSSCRQVYRPMIANPCSN